MKRHNEKKNNKKISRIQHILYWVLLLYRMKIDLRCQWIVICDFNQFYIVAHYWYNFDLGFFSHTLFSCSFNLQNEWKIFSKILFPIASRYSGQMISPFGWFAFWSVFVFIEKRKTVLPKLVLCAQSFWFYIHFMCSTHSNTVCCTGESICIRRQFYSFINRNDAIYSLLSPYITRVPREL